MLEADGINAEKVLEESGELIACTSGTSMYPMLRHRKDMVVIGRVDRPLKKYDVPLYRVKSGKLVLHRILKVTSNGYVIRGDNLYRNEYDITDKNIIGVLKAFYRNGKYCNCEKSRKYRLYIMWVRLSFPIRLIWYRGIRRILVKCKHILFG